MRGATGHGTGHEERTVFKLIVEQPAGPFNRYRIDPSTGGIILAGIVPDAPTRALEIGYLSRTRTEHGQPLRAAVAAPLPTFEGCIIPVHLLGLLRPAAGPPLVLAVSAIEGELTTAGVLADLPASTQQAFHSLAAGTLAGRGEAESLVRAAAEAERRYQAGARHRNDLPAWKVSDESPPDLRGGEAQQHTFAEQAVRHLPARFQEYIARALLPEERILMFVTRPALLPRRGLPGLRRAGLREGILVITDRQLMLMTDSSDADTTFVHWGYIARASAIERLGDVDVRQGPRFATLTVTFIAARGAEHCSFDFPLNLAPAVHEAAELLQGFLPSHSTRALRRLYARELPAALPSLAAAPPPAEAPLWVAHLLPNEDILAWASAPAARGDGAQMAVGTRHVALTPDHEPDHLTYVPVDQITSLQMVLSLMGSRLEIAAAAGEAVHRTTIRFDYPAAPPFLTAFTAIRHLLGLPPGGADHQQRIDR